MAPKLDVDLGSRADLLAILAAVREHAETIRTQAIEQTNEHAVTGGPHPDRHHVIALTGKFLLEYWNLVAEWARWAELHVEKWPQTETMDGIHIPPDPSSRPLPGPRRSTQDRTTRLMACLAPYRSRRCPRRVRCRWCTSTSS